MAKGCWEHVVSQLGDGGICDLMYCPVLWAEGGFVQLW